MARTAGIYNPMSRYESFLRFAQRVYYRLPVNDKTKWRIRAALLPILLAMRQKDKPMAEAIRATLARQPLRDNARELRHQALLLDLAREGVQSVSHLIAVPFLGTGGAENVAANFAKAVRQLSPHHQVLVVVADREMVDDRVSKIDGVHVVVLGPYTDGSYGQKRQLLDDLVVALRPAVLHNINSEVAWNLIIESGERITQVTKIFASIFAFQFASDGATKIGYAAYFLQPGLPWLTGLLSDNRRFVDDARSEYSLGEIGKKLLTVYNPSRVATSGWKSRALERLARYVGERHLSRPAFLWAGRLDKEKRVDLLIEMARQLSSVDFYVYGQSVVDAEESLPDLPNLHTMGAFSSPEELVNSRLYNGFVFTSKWEGMPNILLEVGALGLPIIAPAVGGVGELITSETGYLLPSKPSVGDYVKAMQEMIENPKEAERRTRALVELIDTRHTWESFVGSVRGIADYGI